MRQIDPAEAERVIRTEQVHLLDVRTPPEFVSLGHIPEAKLLPVDLIASAPALLPRDGTPILVYCEHGIRSQAAAQFLVQAGFSQVLNLVGGMSCWRGDRAYEPQPMSGPGAWLLDNVDFRRRGSALDLACGRGRHALLLGAAGWHVRAVDRDAEKIGELQTTADRLGLHVRAEVLDLETGTVDLGHELYDLIVVTRYLHRPLFPALFRALAPTGMLIYETFTVGQKSRGGPSNPDFLLQPAELRKLVAPLEVIRAREGQFDGQMIASVAARKPASANTPGVEGRG